MLKIATLFIATAFSISLLMLGCEWMETIEITYPSFEAAVKDRAIGNDKLLPAILPASSTSIKKIYNIDTNEMWLSFNFNPNDLPHLVKTCKQASNTSIVNPRKAPGNSWPDELIQHASSPGQLSTNYDYYHCEDSATLAIDGNRSEAFYWRLG